jgi:poly-gamma-glutamate synthesis protein (capsule biosynthesis protein)
MALWGRGFAWMQGFYIDYGGMLSAEAREGMLVMKSIEAKISASRPISVIFTGDIMLSRGVDYQIKKNKDFNYPFLKIAGTVKSADIAFGNLEGPISARGSNQGSIYSFRDDPKVVEGLKSAGFDALSLANNHMLDWGRESLEDTVSILKANNIEPVGAGKNYDEANKPMIKEVNGTRFIFIAYTNLLPSSFKASKDGAGISEFNLENIKKVIEDAKKNVDIVVVSLHWGEEYSKSPSSWQKNLAHAFIDSGADLIIGHHPHVVQGIEKYKNGWIAYSLGNFVFDQNFSEETMKGLMVKAIIRNKKLVDFKPIKISISKTFQPQVD